MDAQAFFIEHAGYSYDPERETADEGRARCAASLAEAEAWAKSHGVTFDWRDDWGVDHESEFDCYDDGPPSTCEVCIARGPDGEVLSSLGCIDDASDEYRRVIEAELADEARSGDALLRTEVPDDFPVRPLLNLDEARHYDEADGIWRHDGATCGTCGLSWDDGIVTGMTPAPSARCPFEHFHRDGD